MKNLFLSKCILVLFAFLLFNLGLNCKNAFSNPGEKIHVLQKIGQIGEKFSEGENCFFWHIDDLCCDDENNLYVADSGWNKIFKFNPGGRYLGSFGREGQGPGEFLAQPGRFPLRISFGNDGNIYVTD